MDRDYGNTVDRLASRQDRELGGARLVQRRELGAVRRAVPGLTGARPRALCARPASVNVHAPTWESTLSAATNIALTPRARPHPSATENPDPRQARLGLTFVTQSPTICRTTCSASSTTGSSTRSTRRRSGGSRVTSRTRTTAFGAWCGLWGRDRRSSASRRCAVPLSARAGPPSPSLLLASPSPPLPQLRGCTFRQIVQQIALRGRAGKCCPGCVAEGRGLNPPSVRATSSSCGRAVVCDGGFASAGAAQGGPRAPNSRE